MLSCEEIQISLIDLRTGRVVALGTQATGASGLMCTISMTYL
jgi:hypothetical protein